MQIVGAVVIGYILAQFLDFDFFGEPSYQGPANVDEEQFDEEHPEYILTLVFSSQGKAVWRYQLSTGLSYDGGELDERGYEDYFIIGNEDGTSFRTESGSGGITVPPRTGQKHVSVYPSAEVAINKIEQENSPPPTPTPTQPQPEPEPEPEPEPDEEEPQPQPPSIIPPMGGYGLPNSPTRQGVF
jgi:hypothetical protein|tara:strand:+ start:5462 stop:6016 length:555 start_codon:yes stop_codon:yes gene_type:complete